MPFFCFIFIMHGSLGLVNRLLGILLLPFSPEVFSWSLIRPEFRARIFAGFQRSCSRLTTFLVDFFEQKRF